MKSQKLFGESELCSVYKNIDLYIHIYDIYVCMYIYMCMCVYISTYVAI